MEWFNGIKKDLTKCGLSKFFLKLLKQCVKEKAFVLRLDGDGQEIEGLKLHGW